MRVRFYYLANLLGCALLVTVAIVTGRHWLLAPAAVGPTAGIVLITIARKRARQSHAPAWHAKPDAPVLTPTAFPPLPPTGFAWTGGCNVPADLGRLNATYPLARLLAAPGSARIEPRPRFLQALFGHQPRTFVPALDTVVFPVVGGFGTKGIGLQSRDQPPYYFWTSQQPLILTALSGCGFAVNWQQARAKLW